MKAFTQSIFLQTILLVQSSVQSDIIQAQYFVKNAKSDIMYEGSSVEKTESRDLISCMKTCSDRNCLVVLYNRIQGHCFISYKPVTDSDGTPRLGMTRWDVTMQTGRIASQDVAPEHMGGRVLVAPRINGKTSFIQIDVHNNTASNFRNPKLNQIFTMVYDSVADRLLIGLKVKRKIMSCNLTDSTTFVLVSRATPTSLSIDAKKRLIFFTSTWPGTVKRVDLSRKYKSAKEIVFMKRQKFYCTAVYPKGEKLMFSSGDTIFSTNYNGKKMFRLVERVNTKCLSVDPYGGYLFFSHKQSLMKIRMAEPKKKEKIWTLTVNYYRNDDNLFDTHIHDILFDGNYVYISRAKPTAVTQINLKNKNHKQILFQKFDGYRLLLSLVP